MRNILHLECIQDALSILHDIMERPEAAFEEDSIALSPLEELAGVHLRRIHNNVCALCFHLLPCLSYSACQENQAP